MSFIHWLLCKLAEEVNFGSDDADEIFELLERWANSNRCRRVMQSIRRLWAVQNRSINLIAYINTIIALELHETSLISQAELAFTSLLEFRLLAELFLRFSNNETGKKICLKVAQQ